LPPGASSILQILFDYLLVFGYVIATGIFAALSTFQVVGGIDGLAPWAGIVFSNFLEPFFITNRLDSFKIDPELDPMRHFRLESFQVIAGILFTFAAKVDASLSCASGHLAFLAIGQPFVRPASIALALFLRKMQLCRKPFEPFRIFGGGNKP
jgi:hypothetical protein